MSVFATSAARPIALAARSRLPSVPYVGTIFLSAFLLFLVQPIVAKQILPWFGGSAAVWTTCLVFFQSVLLAGYAYADLTQRLSKRQQAMLHVALLAVSLLSLPILASSSWQPAGDEAPVTRIMLLLFFTIGLPYFLLSTTTPLLQSWYWSRFRAVVPYRLFALSNFASLLALLGFPVLLEPWFSLQQLAWGWSIFYVLFVVFCVITACLSWRHQTDVVLVNDVELNSSAAAVVAYPSLVTQLLWLSLSAMSSLMLLAVTNHVTQNIASVPFMWVVPLVLYLFSFILCFDRPRWRARRFYQLLLLLLLPAMAYKIGAIEIDLEPLLSVVPHSWGWVRVIDNITWLPLFLLVLLYMAGLFAACMFCHGELVSLKPDPTYLTRFYLMMSAGGALGAGLIAIAAPLALSGYYELPIGLVLLALLLALRQQGSWLLLALVVLLITVYLTCRSAWEYGYDVRAMARDFYGVVRTRDRYAQGVTYRAMFHGGIVHGGQLQGEQYERMPSDYFGPGSGYGRLFKALNEQRPAARRIGVIGLGAGVVAAYGRLGDEIRFFEISPVVVDIQHREFTFLEQSAAKIDVVMGDGRLSLERELKNSGSGQYDLLGIDAFSSDSIPMHLITREAMQLYLSHLKPDGVMVFQATNRYIDIVPVIKRHADELGLHLVLVSDSPASSIGPNYWLGSTDQVLVSRDRKLLSHSDIQEAAAPLASRPDLPTFTDAHHNLIRILK